MPETTKFERKTFDAGGFVFREGDFADAIYIIVKGAVEIKTTTKDDHVHKLTTLKKGEVFGEMALIEGRPRQASAEAVQETEVIIIPRKEFFSKLLLLDPLMKKIIIHLTVLLHETTDRLNKCEDR